MTLSGAIAVGKSLLLALLKTPGPDKSRPPWLAVANGALVAEIAKCSPFRESFEILFDGARYDLKPVKSRSSSGPYLLSFSRARSALAPWTAEPPAR